MLPWIGSTRRPAMLFSFGFQVGVRYYVPEKLSLEAYMDRAHRSSISGAQAQLESVDSVLPSRRQFTLNHIEALVKMKLNE